MVVERLKRNVASISRGNLISKYPQPNLFVVSLQAQLLIGAMTYISTGHTPMREMVAKYNTVLVVGGEGEKCRQVAEGYGFRDVVPPGDIIRDNAATTPFRKLTPEEHKNSRPRNHGETKIEAIL